MAKKSTVVGRGAGEGTEAGLNFWQMFGAEAKKTVDADSVVARQMLTRLSMAAGEDGIIRFPNIFTENFSHGILNWAKGAQAFNIQWVST